MPADIVRAEELKQRYLTEAIVTASPATRLTMLYDRMIVDLRRADDGFESGDLKEVNDNLCHVQEILLTLRATLRTDLWEAAGELVSLYSFLHRELVLANLNKDREQARRAGTMIHELAEAWRQASQATSSEHVPLPAAAGFGVA